MTPPWVSDAQWHPLHPPADVLKLGESPRSPEKLLAATRALSVLTAFRYQPGIAGTMCNIYLADVCQILAAPLPHLFDIGDGRGMRELQANDIVDGLRGHHFLGWSMIGTMASAAAVETLANEGKPVVAVWKNLEPRRTSDGKVITHDGRIIYRSGHVAIVVPPPPGAHGVYVTGAGARCVEQCPIAAAFGAYLGKVEFYGHE